MIEYHFEVDGTAADGQTWQTAGLVHINGAGDFHRALEQAQVQTFNQLTRGKAVYGHPGIGCRGPYRITKLTIEEI